jgi:hypothetical protein
MYKTKHKRNKISKKTRKNKKYYGGADVHPLKKSELIFDGVGDKLSSYTSAIINYGKEKGLRLLGLQPINQNEIKEDTTNINESVEKASEGVSKMGSDVVNVFDKGSAALISNINEVLGSNIVNESLKDTARNLGETSTQLLHTFNQAVSTPEFKQETKVALDNAAEIADIFVKSSEKPVNDAIDVLNKAGAQAIAGVSSGAIKVATDAMAAVPGYGAIVEIGKMANDLSAAAGDVVEATTTATEAISKAVQETSNNINQSFETLEKVKKNLPSSNPNLNPNTNLNPSLNPSLNPNPNTNPNISLMQRGGFKELVNEKYQVAGRINNSINEFNNPNYYSIMKKGGNIYNKTKKYSMNDKGKTKRVRFSL